MKTATTLNGGSITNKNDWYSTGYIEIPEGAKRVKWQLQDASTHMGRLGFPTSNTQTSGIQMTPNNANTNETFTIHSF